MGRSSGAGLGLLVLLALFLFKDKKLPSLGNGYVGNGYPPTAPQLFYLQLQGEMAPQTEEQAQEVTEELIRTRKIIVHRTVKDIPTIPTVTQIETASARIAEIDKSIPTWVKKRWGQTPILPKGEV